MAAIFYRVVKYNPPTREDFLSHEQLGKPLLREDLRELWTGISCQATEQQARRTAKMPGFGSFIAKLELQNNSAVRWRRTGSKPGHHTLWGDPDELLQSVVEVIPI